MKFKAPEFWYRDGESNASLIEIALTPFSCLYSLGHKLHQLSKKSEKLSVPVICIGNINIGGSGKTPASIAILKLIKKYNLAKNPCFLTRGYGGNMRGPLMVDMKQHSSADVGDEPLLLSEKAPTVISTDRAKGAFFAQNKKYDLIIMDDGLQNPSIAKDLKIIVINGDMGFGNSKIIPAGPLREKLDDGLENADAFLIIGRDKRNIRALLPEGKPVISAALKATGEAMPKDKIYIAFAGLGYPKKFFSFLKQEMNMNIVEEISFPDHYNYTAKDLNNLDNKSLESGAELITTQKDHIRIPEGSDIHINILPVELVWDDESVVMKLLKSKIT